MRKFLSVVVIFVVVVSIGIAVFFIVNIEDKPMASITIEELSFVDDIQASINGQFYLERMDINFIFDFDVCVYDSDGYELSDYEISTYENSFDMVFDERTGIGSFKILADHKAQKTGFEYHITPLVWWFDSGIDGGALHEIYGDKFVHIIP